MTTNYVGWILSVLVLLLLIAFGLILQNSVRLFVSGKRADGIVVGMDKKDNLQSPIVEFVTSEGEHIRIHGHAYSEKVSVAIGEGIHVAYSRSDPRNAQFLLLAEFPFGPAGVVLGFIVFIVLIWISCILLDPVFNDPFHLLSRIISHFRLNPFRFPILLILSIVIPACGLGTYLWSIHAFELRSKGIMVIGHVIDFQNDRSHVRNGVTVHGVFPMIAYDDASGESHTIRRKLAKPLSRLKIGDAVEVIYLPNQTNEGIVNTWDEIWLLPLFLGFMTIAFLFALRLVLKGTLWF